MKNKKIKKLALAITFVLALLVITTKLFFIEHNFIILYIYGILISFILSVVFFVAIYRYQDLSIIALKKEKLLKNKKVPLVSCLVAVYNEENKIEKCIDSIVAQTYKNKEIIFINDGSTDTTRKILNSYAKKGLIKVIHQKNAGKKKALAAGIKLSKGTIFAMTDSDSYWQNDILEKMVPIFNIFPSVGGVSGHYRLSNPNINWLTKTQDSWVEGQFSIRKAFESYYGVVTCISGPSAFFRKEAIYNFIPAWEDDTFLGQEFKFSTDRTLTGYLLGNKTIGKKLKERYKNSYFIKEKDYPLKGWDVIYSKSLKSFTSLPDNFKSLIKQHVRWKKSFIRNIFLTGKFYWRKDFLPALIYYLHIIFVIASPIMSFWHLIYLPITTGFNSTLLYLGGIIYIGFLFGIMIKIDNPKSKIWYYRPLMSLLSSILLSWLLIYSALTIKNNIWYRDK